MRCVILGGGGFLGRHIGRAMAGEGAEVWSVDRSLLAARIAPWLAGEVQADCFDLSTWWDMVGGADVIVHLASSTVPATASEDPIGDVQANLVGTLRLLHDLRGKAARPRLLFASSGGAVYGRPLSVPLSELHPTMPMGAYGATKLAIEHHLRIEEAQYGLPIRILRLSNPYGEWQQPHGVQGVIAVFAHRALHSTPVDVWGDGSVVRDFVYAADVGRAFVAAARHQGESRIFNVGGGLGTSVNDILVTLERLLGRTVERRVFPARSFDPPVNVLDIRRAQDELKWKPEMAFGEGVAKAVDWLRTVA
ncbi:MULTISPECIES: NAD-dependent epimerase/dehydratase family protein [Acidovorax]|nr:MULTISPECIES: NAD-dependent epimerase/dehydratase family protein [Acidovorax]KRA12996.1 epimerase [Acidovorax sp. Root568]MBD9405930.1 NAD-dependent epimerase/dehydratase family protein [Acidovorax sp. ACV02]